MTIEEFVSLLVTGGFVAIALGWGLGWLVMEYIGGPDER